ncbi:MAG: HAD family hydrolase, partial [Ruminococcus sp.]|nr:HAD family hydrolase [Ruminococcus sp.]
NDGGRNNDEVFWEKFLETYGEEFNKDRDNLDAYYNEEFLKVQGVCGFNPLSKEVVERIKKAGMRVALATQPIFPEIATIHRTRWAGLDVSDFDVVTTFENIGYCKPSKEYYLEVCRRMNLSSEDCLMVGNDTDDDMPAKDAGLDVSDFEVVTTFENIGYCKPSKEYYLEVCRRMNLSAEDCLMVGNDTDDDMPAKDAGLDVFLLTDCLINHSGKDINDYPHGDFSALLKYLEV